MEEPLFEVRGLAVTSGSRVLQKDLTFSVDRGRMLAIVGESGSGKRILFRTMTGVREPAEGEVLYFGTNPWTVSDRDRRRLHQRIGVFMAGGALVTTRTLLENVSLPFQAHSPLSARDVRSAARLKLALMGLAGYENHYPGEVDAPRRTAAALARAMALDPEILFCERPTFDMHPKAAARLRQTILGARAMGAAVVVVTNDPTFVLEADEALFLGLESKTMKARGAPAHLRDHAADPEVRAFLRGPEL